MILPSGFPDTNLRDGLALSYAAADKGNSKEAKRAREAAYTEDEPPVKGTDENLLYQNLSKSDLPSITKAVKKGAEPPKMTTLIGDPNKKADISLLSNRSEENMPVKGVRFKAKMDEANNQDKSTPKFEDVKSYAPKNSITAELQKREKEKKNHAILPSSIKSIEDLSGDWKSKDYSITTPFGEHLSPSRDALQYLEEYFSDNYNVGKTTAEIVINDVQLEALHKYLTDGVKNMKRPANIGVGIWNKQMQTDLKWIDDMFGKSSGFAKALKTLPAITIGIDTIRGANENIKNNADWGETVSDVVVDIGVGGLEVGTAAALTAGATYLIPSLAGGLPGLIASVIASLAASYIWDYEKYGGDKTIKERLDSIF